MNPFVKNLSSESKKINSEIEKLISDFEEKFKGQRLLKIEDNKVQVGLYIDISLNR